MLERKKVKLGSKSNHGKNRLQYGKIWEIMSTLEKVSFSSLPGKWLLLESVNSDYKFWMNENNDPDNFIIEEVFFV